MDQLANVLLAMDKAYNTREGLCLWVRLRWAKPGLFMGPTAPLFLGIVYVACI